MSSLPVHVPLSVGGSVSPAHEAERPEGSILAPAPASASRRLTWVPIRSLTSRHRARIQTHLLGLDTADRYLRFGYHASDAQIARYADSLDFERDELFGIFNRRLELIAVAHLAYDSAPRLNARPAMAEFGVSVTASARGRGYGARLFDHAVLHARNRGFDTLFIHALCENAAMLKIVRRAGARVERSGAEAEAWLTLPPDNFASQVGAVVEEQAAEWDYRLKEHAQRVQQVLDSVAELKQQFSRVRGTQHEQDDE